MNKTLIILPALVLAATLAACGDGADDEGADGGTLTVLAASSLTDVFTVLAERFEAAHDGVEVELSFGSSTDLAEQAADGAPGDVLATADQTAMAIAEDAGAVEDPATFATNLLVIVTPPDNPAGITGLEDLDGATWVRCADAVPCGRVALAVLEAAGVDAEPASLEEDVRSTLDKVVSGEADAGLVYASDAIAAGADVATLPIAGAEEQLTSYFIADLEQSEDDDLAEAWVELVTGPEGQAVLTEAGFSLP
ncbi:molybdate ABC transporter substrate-binding protein [Nocardioides stalactiti]|uniref:molybdate ABC transporter substrate-binding protein n=1 Tax=Nocardioides stalactiti TaxID=2755356 RepID=UPI00160170C2|nr:molybdate ABC transporter substrate-binding protein [Nocardioides stalactiti]